MTPRIPTKDDPFFITNAGRMFMLLCGVEHHPPGCPISEALRLEITRLWCEAYEDGIDTIGVAECGLQEREYHSGHEQGARRP